MMKWICPICNRNFSRKNQFHNCELYSIEYYHFKKAKPAIKDLYSKIINLFENIGPYTLEPLKSIIAIKKVSQFCSIKVQINSLRVAFRMYSNIISSRFNNTSQQGSMFYYELILKNEDQIDSELISWLKTAYLEN